MNRSNKYENVFIVLTFEEFTTYKYIFINILKMTPIINNSLYLSFYMYSAEPVYIKSNDKMYIMVSNIPK